MALLRSLALIAAFACSHTLSQSVVTDDGYFYGQSPAVYPSPNATGTDAWSAAYAKAQAFVSQLTIDEKTNLTGGYTDPLNGCSGNIWPIERLGFPGMCVTDAGNGVRGTTFVNGYASGIHVGASWNKQLASSRGINMGGEFKKKGVNVQLGPVVGPLGRVSEGGRNWEGFSNDPYLSGTLVAQYIQGAQSIGAGTCTKHFILNEQETNRNPEVNAENQTVASISSNIDDTSMHELYLWPFAEAVRAGTVSIMCSYNRINNSYGCQNSKTLNGLLKTELGFQGFVMSDWDAQHTGVASTLAGLDMTMPLGDTYWGPNLTESVQNGTVPEQRLDDMATRIIATWYLLGQDTSITQPGYGMPADLIAPHQVVDARAPTSRPHLMQEAIEGHVLVKNVNGALPLQTPKLLSIFGYDATAPQTNDPSSGFSAYSLGAESTDAAALLCGFGIPGECPPWLPYAPYGTLVTGSGSGATQPAYINAPFNAIQQRAIQDGTALLWDFATINSTTYVDPTSEAAIIFINAQSSEGIDRTGLRDDFSDGLVKNVASQHNNTIVVIHNAGVRLVDQWIENPNVTAVIFAHLPGQDSGAAITSILYGDVSPSGKLPYTVAKNESDYGSIFGPVNTTSGQYEFFPQDNFTEGVYIDYRAFDAKNIIPRYEFGYGLTYTTFSYSNIAVSSVSGGNNASIPQYPSGAIISGGHADLYDNVATVSATVTNTGTVAAAEVAQLYVSIPASNQPVRQLRGFEKVMLAPNASATVQFDLRRKDMSVWDVVAQQWSLVPGAAYTVSVGASSRDLPLTAEITL